MHKLIPLITGARRRFSFRYGNYVARGWSNGKNTVAAYGRTSENTALDSSIANNPRIRRVEIREHREKRASPSGCLPCPPLALSPRTSRDGILIARRFLHLEDLPSPITRLATT